MSNSEVGVKVKGRLAILAAHLAAPPPSDLSSPPIIEPWCVSAQTAASLGGSLTIIDERTGKKYQVPVSAEGTVKAVDLKKITTGKDDKGLKMYDPGYLNTAPVRSSISYIDGDQGILRYRGYPIEELAESSTFLEVAHLLMYGNLPSESQLADWEFAVSQHSAVPQGILDIIQSMPHDAHPMGVLVSAVSALPIFHPDANPALMGQDIYGSKQTCHLRNMARDEIQTTLTEDEIEKLKLLEEADKVQLISNKPFIQMVPQNMLSCYRNKDYKRYFKPNSVAICPVNHQRD
ncbi:hypothetical protein SLA2020_378860 [Shorea laevis]